MFGFLFRTLWRLVIFIAGLFLAYACVYWLFPYLDNRAPMLIAILIVYCFVAYIGIPTLIRAWRLVIKPNHIPLYATTPDGWPSDPVNIAIITKSKHKLISSMAKAGWFVADKSSFKNLWREAYALIFNKPYPTAPFSALLLFGRTFDIGFQIPYGKNGSPRHRHHVRFWQLEVKIDNHHHESFWARLFQRFFKTQKTVWIGAAINDTGFGMRQRNFQITHKVKSAHIDERDFIIQSLKQQNLVKRTHDFKAGEPFKMRGQNFGSEFIVDGYIRVVELKK